MDQLTNHSEISRYPNPSIVPFKFTRHEIFILRPLYYYHLLEYVQSQQSASFEFDICGDTWIRVPLVRFLWRFAFQSNRRRSTTDILRENLYGYILFIFYLFTSYQIIINWNHRNHWTWVVWDRKTGKFEINDWNLHKLACFWLSTRKITDLSFWAWIQFWNFIEWHVFD